MYTMSYNALLAPHVEKHQPKVEQAIDTALDAACKQLGGSIKKEHVYGKISDAREKATQLKADLAGKIAPHQDKANAHVARLVGKFEKAAPQFAGVFPQTVGDALVFGVYVYLVLYFLLAILQKALAFYCFVCCCGCCSRRQSDSSAKKVTKEGKNGKHSNGVNGAKAAATKKGK